MILGRERMKRVQVLCLLNEVLTNDVVIVNNAKVVIVSQLNQTTLTLLRLIHSKS